MQLNRFYWIVSASCGYQVDGTTVMTDDIHHTEHLWNTHDRSVRLSVYLVESLPLKLFCDSYFGSTKLFSDSV